MKLSILNSRLVSVGLAGALAVGVLGVGGVAMAQTGDGGTPTERHPVANHPKIRIGIVHLIDNAGVTREELKQGGEAGLTLGQIIDQYGDISAEQAKANALQALSNQLDDAVANGQLTQEQADRIEAAAPGAVDRLLNAVPGSHHDGDGHPRIRTITKHSLETVANVLSISPADLLGQLRDGKTIQEVAGPQSQAVVEALVTDANTAIENAVADGTLPADKEQAAKERAAQAIQKFMTRTWSHLGGQGN
ncbi:MAG TPA: hypothetical protein PKI89_00925 [Tepidiformaceae bacterium]|nr:hypothetical protein [Tepidiformaceae bacterium]HNO65096.1 hypothetical protein [Tepidiformaceae bacterium]